MTAGEASSTKRPKRALRARKQTLKELAEEIASEIMAKQEARKAAQAAWRAANPDATPPSLISTIAFSEYDDHGMPLGRTACEQRTAPAENLGPSPGQLWRQRGR